MTVHIETAHMGVSMLIRDCGESIRLAYDPHRISEAQALALLCTRIPRLIGGGFRIMHAAM